MLELLPILKSLYRHKTGPVLIIIQLALTIAIVSNALFFIAERTEHINRSTGLAHEQLSKIWVKAASDREPMRQVIERDLAAVRQIPGVIDAAPLSSVPFSHAGSSSVYTDSPRGQPNGRTSNAATLESDHHALDTLGLRLIEGRNFFPEEIQYFTNTALPDSGMAIITHNLAEDLFQQETAIDKTVYLAGAIPLTVVGVVDNFLGYLPDAESGQRNVLIAGLEDRGSANYVVRSEPRQTDEVLGSIEEALRGVDDNRVIQDQETLQAMMSKHYSNDSAMVIILSIVIASLILINMLGIVGITTFRVNQRRRQIGIRRALGATRLAIARYFLLENVMLVIAATIAGAMIAYQASHYLVLGYGLDLLPWQYVPLAGIVVLVITLAAAIAPARRAACFPPREAVAGA